MGRRPVQNKKTPSEYPQFSFRVTRPTKDDLSKIVDQVQKKLNRHRKVGDPWVNKNDVIVMALYEGLKRI